MSVQNPLVSLIIPCYNGEDFINRCLDSVLNQSYSYIQFILIDDGSTDNTVVIIEAREEELHEKLEEFIFIRQENGGAASAVNTALKYVKGKYIAWADSDDVLQNDNILKKVDFLRENEECALVACNARELDMITGREIRKLLFHEKIQNSDLFMTLIFGEVPCYPGVFMVRTQALFSILTKREIYYHPEVGQNWQLLLPVAYKNKCGFIDEVLYDYYVRTDSHSHNQNYENQVLRTYCQEEVLLNTLTFIENGDGLFQKIRVKYALSRFNISFDNCMKEDMKKYYEDLKKDGYLTYKIWIKYHLLSHGFLRVLYDKVIKG